MPQHLHIICLNVPYPVDFGAMYDLFYKLPALQQAGIAVHLHCFTYNRSPQKELEKYCASVHYYPRKTGISGISFTLPYIVASRRSADLFQTLLKDDYPILIEGVHCTYPLLDKRFSNRKLFVRLHNVEYRYYYHLYKNTTSLFKRLYYLAESFLLKNYERRIANKASAFWTVSYKDANVYRGIFNCKNAGYLPLFLPPWQVAGKLGTGTYCIYHGNLEVEENEQAATWLIKKVFINLDIPLIVAGKNPTQCLVQAAARTKNVQIIANPSSAGMDNLIMDAHIQVLPSFNTTGIKIKLLNALYNGRHCIVNNAAIEDTGLEGLCHIANTASDMQQLVKALFTQPFTQAELDKRKAVLYNHFNNAASAQQIRRQIWGDFLN
ncbi:glycosyltransferase [Ilyomonas limi]|uniref:Glycosyltransferase n=1 Tax=Ilyomonas limi TaxID=2575867 RepID=A0A4U3KZS4_9BACT|nr:glycosyltransferase [Ilyomonas limi]TKK68050.1 glycosyltransferase [Ilyomonas limi]